MKKIFALALSLALAVAIGIGGTLAWLTDTTPELKNTFTVGKVNIALAETATDFKMVPGQTIAKDPKVTVESGSEDCWLFVKIDKSENMDTFISYAVADDWIKLTGADGVYYRQVPATDNPRAFSIIGYIADGTFNANEVLVNEEVTKDDMDGLNDDTHPTLTFTAYAVQYAGFENPGAAWAKIPTP